MPERPDNIIREIPWIPSEGSLYVAPLSTGNRTAGGLHMPDNVEDREKPTRAIVLSHRPKPGEPHVETGTMVQFGKYAGLEMDPDDGGPGVIVLRQEEVMGWLDPCHVKLVHHVLEEGISTVPIAHLASETCTECDDAVA